MTINQHAILPSLCIGIAVTAVAWVSNLEWEEMGRAKLPLLVAALAIGIAGRQVQRYVTVLRQHQARRREHPG